MKKRISECFETGLHRQKKTKVAAMASYKVLPRLERSEM